MKISMTTAGLLGSYGVDGTYRMLCEAGFEAVDAGLSAGCGNKKIRSHALPETVASESAVLDYARPFAEAAEKYGMENFQAHAPFPVWCGDEQTDRRMVEITRWFIHAADSIGCRNLIIHPIVSFNDAPLTLDELWEKNTEFFAQMIPAAKEYGVKVCLENMVRYHTVGKEKRPFESSCADLNEACCYIDTLNELAGTECFGFCLDTGHMHLVHRDPQAAIRTLDSRLTALHLNDNIGSTDQHLMPYMGMLDWEAVTLGLAEVDYAGTVNFESHGTWDVVDPELIPNFMKLTADIGRLFVRKIEEKKKSL